MSGDPISENDDLHLLMGLAVLSFQNGVDVDVTPISAVWQQAYPNDALGPLFDGMTLIRAGEVDAGIALIEEKALTAATRADQAKDVLDVIREEQLSAG